MTVAEEDSGATVQMPQPMSVEFATKDCVKGVVVLTTALTQMLVHMIIVLTIHQEWVYGLLNMSTTYLQEEP